MEGCEEGRGVEEAGEGVLREGVVVVVVAGVAEVGVTEGMCGAELDLWSGVVGVGGGCGIKGGGRLGKRACREN